MLVCGRWSGGRGQARPPFRRVSDPLRARVRGEDSLQGALAADARWHVTPAVTMLCVPPPERVRLTTESVFSVTSFSPLPRANTITLLLL